MTEPKVFAILTFAPSHWPITQSPNGNRQVRAVAQVNSKAAFARLLLEHGVRESTYSINQAVHTTGNEQEVEAATSQPGVLFRATGDMSRIYVPAEKKD